MSTGSCRKESVHGTYDRPPPNHPAAAGPARCRTSAISARTSHVESGPAADCGPWRRIVPCPGGFVAPLLGSTADRIPGPLSTPLPDSLEDGNHRSEFYSHIKFL